MPKPCAVAFVFLPALCLSAWQAPQEPWQNLRQLRPGEDIEVVTVQMKSHRCQFAGYTQDEIALRLDGRDVSFTRAEVASVKRRGQSHRRRNALLGLAVAAAGGLAVGAIRGATYHESGEVPVFIAVWTPVGAGIGAAVGGALPSGGEVTVYRASALTRH